jgi:hypothetical protein
MILNENVAELGNMIFVDRIVESVVEREVIDLTTSLIELEVRNRIVDNVIQEIKNEYER